MHLASEQCLNTRPLAGYTSGVTSRVTQPGPLSLISPGEQAPRSTLNVEPAHSRGTSHRRR